MFGISKNSGLDAQRTDLQKIQQAVDVEIAKLSQLKAAATDAERKLSNVLANEALGDDADAVQKAVAHVTEGRAEVDLQRKRVSAVRGKLWTVATTAATEAAAVKPETLAAEAERAAKTFATEWASAARNWAAALARRRQIERLLFKPLRELPEAAPSEEPTIVADIMPVHSGLTSLLHRLSAAGGTDTSLIPVEGDEVPLRTNFLTALQALEAVERRRHAVARHEALEAEGR